MTTDTTTCVICKAGDIPAEGKHIHCCIVREGRAVISREFIGWFDGRPINYGSRRTDVETELDHYVSGVLARTAVEAADIAAERAEQDVCPICNGEGRVPNGSGCGELAGGWANVCDECDGKGTHEGISTAGDLAQAF